MQNVFENTQEVPGPRQTPLLRQPVENRMLPVLERTISNSDHPLPTRIVAFSENES
jgi:hypothetical protein